MSEINSKNEWDNIISSDYNKIELRIKTIWHYRDLILLFVKRDFIIYYKQTILGPIWYIIQPVLSTLMYMIVFGSLANISTDSIPQPLFYFAGTMLWTYFSNTLLDVSNVFAANKNMLGKVYFPRLVIPIANMISLLIKFLIQSGIFVCIYLFYLFKGAYVGASLWILISPLIVFWIGLLGCGIGMVISSVTSRYKDLALALNYLVTLFMYATPVVYPFSQVPEKWKFVFALNPVCAPMELFRKCLFHVSALPLWSIGFSLVVTFIMFLFGLIVFNKIEKTFIDVI